MSVRLSEATRPSIYICPSTYLCPSAYPYVCLSHCIPHALLFPYTVTYDTRVCASISKSVSHISVPMGGLVLSQSGPLVSLGNGVTAIGTCNGICVHVTPLFCRACPRFCFFTSFLFCVFYPPPPPPPPPFSPSPLLSCAVYKAAIPPPRIVQPFTFS